MILWIVILFWISKPWEDKKVRFNRIVSNIEGAGVVSKIYLNKKNHSKLTFNFSNGEYLVWPGPYNYKDDLSSRIEVGDSLYKEKNSLLIKLYKGNQEYFLDLETDK